MFPAAAFLPIQCLTIHRLKIIAPIGLIGKAVLCKACHSFLILNGIQSMRGISKLLGLFEHYMLS